MSAVAPPPLLRGATMVMVPSGDSPLLELGRTWHVLAGAVSTYLMLAYSLHQIGALIMLDVCASLGMSVGTFSLIMGAGNLLKFALMHIAGPVIDRLGARVVVVITLVLAASLLAVMGAATGPVMFGCAMVILLACSAFADQPTFVVLFVRALPRSSFGDG